MTYKYDYTLLEELLEQITEQGFEALPELIRTIINAAMQIERQNHLGVELVISDEWETGRIYLRLESD